jgi:predicted  nucleic acid-binding Zn-ribbon protein
MKHLMKSILAIFWLLLAFLSVEITGTPSMAAQLEPASSQANYFEKIEEVITGWNESNQLFVHGNLGVQPRRLDELASWLNQNGKHWSIVLMETAEGQQYRTADGQEYFGMDAVEHALGHGLNNQTSFGKLTHSVTGQRDAAVFVLFLRERKFSYYSSEAQDTRALGKARWIGELDKPAIQAMRNGGRIVDAVMDTVNSVNKRLDGKIRSEILFRKRAQQAKWLFIACSIAGVIAALLAWLWWLNRKRQPWLKQAIDAFTQREDSVRQETDQIDKLFTRNADILGSREKIGERGYTGQTRQVSEAALNSVDDLFIMSKEVNRVLEQARQLVYPTSLTGRVKNLFSSERYHQAMQLLSGKPLKFTRRDGLPWVLRDQLAKKMGLSQPLEENQIPDEISLTFEEAYDAFRQRGVEARDTLATIEDCLTNVHERLDRLQSQLSEVSEREKALAAAASQDGFFEVSNAVNVLLPSIQSDLTTADEQSTFDAVQAMQVSLPSAERKLGEFSSLMQKLEKAREELIPRLETAHQALKALNYPTHWIDDALREIGQRVDSEVAAAATHPIAEQIDQVAASLQRLDNVAMESVTLAKAIHEKHLGDLNQLDAEIEAERTALANELKLTKEAVFNELDREPAVYAKNARGNLDAAKTMLTQGRSEPAASALETMATEAKKSRWLVEQSRHAVQRFSAEHRSHNERLTQLRSNLNQTSTAVEAAQREFASAALMVSEIVEVPSSDHENSASSKASIPDTPAPSILEILPGSRVAESILDTVRELAQSTQRLLDNSQVDHRRGYVLKAADQLREAELLLSDASAQVKLVDNHLNRLRQLTQENVAQQDASEQAMHGLRQEAQDPLVMASTLTLIEQAASALSWNRQEMERMKIGINPFDTHRFLASAQAKLKELKARIVADRQGHAEASRAVNGAEKQVESARRLVLQSQNDGITDSRKTTELNQRIAQFAQAAMSVKRSLQVPHGDWQMVDDEASRLHTDLSKATDELSSELQLAAQAHQAFEVAAQSVYQAEQWSGPWGLRVFGSPGVQDLERARMGLQSGDYSIVLELSRIAANAAKTAILQAEREIARRRMEEQLAAERARRAAEATRRRNRNPGGGFGGGFGGSFGGLGGGIGGFSSGGGSRSSGSSSGGSSGFSRSGW